MNNIRLCMQSSVHHSGRAAEQKKKNVSTVFNWLIYAWNLNRADILIDRGIIFATARWIDTISCTLAVQNVSTEHNDNGQSLECLLIKFPHFRVLPDAISTFRSNDLHSLAVNRLIESIVRSTAKHLASIESRKKSRPKRKKESTWEHSSESFLAIQILFMNRSTDSPTDRTIQSTESYFWIKIVSTRAKWKFYIAYIETTPCVFVSS